MPDSDVKRYAVTLQVIVEATSAQIACDAVENAVAAMPDYCETVDVDAISELPETEVN